MVLEHHHYSMEEALSRGRDTRLHMTRPEVVGLNHANRVPPGLDGKP